MQKCAHVDEASIHGKKFPYFSSSATTPIISLRAIEYSLPSVEQGNCKRSLWNTKEHARRSQPVLPDVAQLKYILGSLFDD